MRNSVYLIGREFEQWLAEIGSDVVQSITAVTKLLKQNTILAALPASQTAESANVRKPAGQLRSCEVQHLKCATRVFILR